VVNNFWRLKINYNLITVLGPTATGKTSFAVSLANELGNCEIISGDSRQVYRGMDIGTGKDLKDFTINEKVKINYHIIDIVDPGYEYNVYEYKKDFKKVFVELTNKEKKVLPILCGGSGLYLEAVLDNYELIDVPVNKEFRDNLKEKEDDELISIFKSYKIDLHNTTDVLYRKRLIRAIEIAEFYSKKNKVENILDDSLDIKPIIFGILFDRKIVRERITIRLKERLKTGMIEEVESLLKSGVTKEKLVYYGLEYKFISQYLDGDFNYNDMFQKLNSAIHQFSKRQATWFRRMERNGFKINWIDGGLSMDRKIEEARKVIGFYKRI